MPVSCCRSIWGRALLQIGGNLATNARRHPGDPQRCGTDNVLGLEAVLADGTVISSMNKMIKTTRATTCGSSSSVRKARSASSRGRYCACARYRRAADALCALDSYENVVALLKRAQKELAGLSAY